jgi:hemolysin D
VSPDAVTPQQLATTPGAAPSGADPTTQAAQAGNSGGQASGAVYAARISLDRDYMDVGGKNVKLSPGMTVTAEIKTGNRTILSYLMSSVGRASDAFHER